MITDLKIKILKSSSFSEDANEIKACLEGSEYQSISIIDIDQLKQEECTDPETVYFIISDLISDEKYNKILDYLIFRKGFIVITIHANNNIPIDEKVEILYQTNALFPPFTCKKVNYTINKAYYLDFNRKQSEERINDYIKEYNLNKQKLRELDAIFKIYKLVDREKNITSLLKNSLPIIASAFYSDTSKISIKITFMDMEFLSEGFETSNRELSDILIDQDGFIGHMILYINDENLEKFPITMEELNTFSTIRSQLSKAIRGIILEQMNRLNFDYSMTIISLFQSFTNNQFTSQTDLFKEAIIKINQLFQPDQCFILHFPNGYDSKRQYYTMHHIEIEEKNELTEWLEKEYDFKDAISNETIFFEKGKNQLTIIPFTKSAQVSGFLIIKYIKPHKMTEYFRTSLFSMISEYLSLSITNLENLNEIMSYKYAIEQSPSTIVLTDLRGNIEYANPHFEQVSGYTLEEAKGKNPRILKSGLQNTEFYKDLWDTISSGKKWHGNFQNKCKDGKIIWESASISPIVDSNGKKLSYIAIKEDITEKVLAEENLKKINNKLISTQTTLVKEEKLASIGRLAAGVAHELNNPIGFINSNFRSLKRYIEKLRELYELDEFIIPQELKEQYQTDFIFEDLLEIISESDDGFNRVINIINSLRSFSRIDESKQTLSIDLNELIKTTLIVAGNELKYTANIHEQYAEIPHISCIVGEINQVFLNLIMNASQSITEQKKEDLGNIYISTEFDGEMVICRISDDGPGIKKEDHLKVFDPFFTTKPVGKGTGLGLSISYDIIVNKHQGSLSINDEYKEGAQFVIKLPLGETDGTE